jgi:hypothetical protein
MALSTKVLTEHEVLAQVRFNQEHQNGRMCPEIDTSKIYLVIHYFNINRIVSYQLYGVGVQLSLQYFFP